MFVFTEHGAYVFTKGFWGLTYPFLRGSEANEAVYGCFDDIQTVLKRFKNSG